MMDLRSIYKKVPARYHYASFLIFGANLSIFSLICAAISGLHPPFIYLSIAFPPLSILAAKLRRNIAPEIHIRSSAILALSCTVLLCIVLLS